MYVPNNMSIFIAAYAGAISGMAVAEKVLTDEIPADYDAISAVAGAFAKSFDTEWALRPTTLLDVSIVEEACEGTWEGRYPSTTNPSFTNPATYTDQCQAIIALITSSGAYFTGQGIVVPPPVADSDAVVFDDAVLASKSNVRTDRLLQSSIADNTKPGSTNFGSNSTGLSSGLNGNYGTIGGGDLNEIGKDFPITGATIAGGIGNHIVKSDNGTICGGNGNSVQGTNGTVCGGFLNQAGSELDAFGTGAFVGGGVGNVARGQASSVLGGIGNIAAPTAIQGIILGGQAGNVQSQNDTIINGYFCQAIGGFSTVVNGSGNIASGPYSTVNGQSTTASRPNQNAHGFYSGVGGSGSQWSRMFVGLHSGVFTDDSFTLVDGVAYLIKVTGVMKQIGANPLAGFEYTILAHAAAGVAVIDQYIVGPNNVALEMVTGFTMDFLAVGNAIEVTVSFGEGFVGNAGVTYDWTEANDVL